MSKKTEKALSVLIAGGFFRKQLETSFVGGEKFQTRLYTKSGEVVKGIGIMTFFEIKESGALRQRECAKSSVWPEEYELSTWTVKRVIEENPEVKVEFQGKVFAGRVFGKENAKFCGVKCYEFPAPIEYAWETVCRTLSSGKNLRA